MRKLRFKHLFSDILCPIAPMDLLSIDVKTTPRCAALDESESAGNSFHVRVYRDDFVSSSVEQDAISGFWTDSGKRDETLPSKIWGIVNPRQVTFPSAHDLARYGNDVICLAVWATSVQYRHDVMRIYNAQRLWRDRSELPDELIKSRPSALGGLVLGKDSEDEAPKGILPRHKI